MSTAQKYTICIVGGVVAEFAIPLLLYLLAIALAANHIDVSLNILPLALPFFCFNGVYHSLPVDIFLFFAAFFSVSDLRVDFGKRLGKSPIIQACG